MRTIWALVAFPVVALAVFTAFQFATILALSYSGTYRPLSGGQSLWVLVVPAIIGLGAALWVSLKIARKV